MLLLGKGVEKVDVDIEGRTVKVWSTLTSQELLEVLKKTGKEVTYVGEVKE